MSNLLLISENKYFIEDLSSQIHLFDSEFQIYTEDNEDTENIDIIVIDEALNKLEQLTEKHPHSAIIALSFEDIEDNKILYKYLKKPFSLANFLTILASCVNIIENTEQGYLRFGNYELHPIKKELFYLKTGKTIKLTEKEVAIIKYLYNAGNKLVYKNELLENVWKYNSDVSTHTLETHIYRLRQKIEKADKRSKFIITREGGYLLKR